MANVILSVGVLALAVAIALLYRSHRQMKKELHALISSHEKHMTISRLNLSNSGFNFEARKQEAIKRDDYELACSFAKIISSINFLLQEK